MTQPAVSQAIMQLEGELDIRLFNRTPKGVSLTGSVMSSPNEKADDQSDKSKDRIWGGQSLYGITDDSYFFYKVD